MLTFINNNPWITFWLSLLLFVLIIYFVQVIIERVDKRAELKYDFNKSFQTEIRADLEMIVASLKSHREKNEKTNIDSVNKNTDTNIN